MKKLVHIALLSVLCMYMIVGCMSCRTVKDVSKAKVEIDSSAINQKDSTIQVLQSTISRQQEELRSASFSQVIFDTTYLPGDTVRVNNTVVIEKDGSLKASGKIKSASVSNEKVYKAYKELESKYDSLAATKNKQETRLIKTTVTKEKRKKTSPSFMWWIIFFILGCIFWHNRKYLLKFIGFTFLIFAFACHKKSDKPLVISDDFGLTTFNTTKRIVPLERRKPRITPPPPIPPTIPPSVIYLDFDGATVEGTQWAYYEPLAVSPAGLTLNEQDDITDSVAVDYANFNVTVTNDSNVFNSSTNGVRCIITESYEWYGRVGGVAFVNRYNKTDPCFVFSMLLSYNTKYIQEAISHEVGHTIGLYHQSEYDENCYKVREYRVGPIMGVSYYTNGYWTVGPTNYGCNNIQDDAALIASRLGAR